MPDTPPAYPQVADHGDLWRVLGGCALSSLKLTHNSIHSCPLDASKVIWRARGTRRYVACVDSSDV
eukprot:1034841-Amphidinium_carterae.1